MSEEGKIILAVILSFYTGAGFAWYICFKFNIRSWAELLQFSEGDYEEEKPEEKQ